LRVMGRASRVFVCVLAALLLGLGGVAGAQERETITIGYYEAGAGQGVFSQVMNRIIALFEEAHPEVRVETTVAAYGAFFERLPVELASGVGPDVWLSDGVLVEQYARLGFGLELTDLIDRELDRNQYFGLDLNTDAQGKIWAFPQGLQASAFFYNKSMFNEAGLSFPHEGWTLEDVRDHAKRLTRDRTGDGVADQFGFRSFNQVTEGWYPVIRAFGGGFLDDTGRNSRLAEPATVDGLQYLVDIVHVDQSSPTTGNMFNHFPQNTVAMQYGLFVRTFPPNEAGIDYDVTLVPSGPAGRFAPAIVNSWMINAHSSPAKQDAAWKWIKFFSSEGPQEMWGSLGEAIPIHRDAAQAFLELDVPPANRMVFVEGLQHAVAIDPSPVWSGWVGAVTAAFRPAFAGQVSAQEAAMQAHQSVQNVLDEYYASR